MVVGAMGINRAAGGRPTTDDGNEFIELNDKDLVSGLAILRIDERTVSACVQVENGWCHARWASPADVWCEGIST